MSGGAALSVSAFGVIVPAASGFALGWHLPAEYLAAPNGRLIFSLFMAVAMSISAVPVIAKILIDLDLMRRDLGLLILGARNPRRHHRLADALDRRGPCGTWRFWISDRSRRSWSR